MVNVTDDKISPSNAGIEYSNDFICKWLLETLAGILKIKIDNVSTELNMQSLDSLNAVELHTEVDNFFKIYLEEQFIFGNVTIRELADEIYKQIHNL